MCRFGCTTTNTTYMCKWCGTRYCRDCLHGEFTGEMKEENWCRVCNQKRCQGKKIEFVEGYVPKEDNKKGRGKGRGSAKGKAGAKKGKKKGKSGKKSGKKKKKR